MTLHSSRTSRVTVSECRSLTTGVADENVSFAKTTTVTSLSTSEDPMAVQRFTVFVSHAGADKATIAIPLRRKLRRKGITAFVDDCDIPRGADAKLCMEHAMATVDIAVIVLSPQYVAKEWPIRELRYLLKRRQECIRQGRTPPVIIPFFYRLSVGELYDEPNFDRIDPNGKLLYESTRFFERQRNRNPEANVCRIKKMLDMVHRIMGVQNIYGATNESSHDMSKKREILLYDLCKEVCKAEKWIRQCAITQDETSKEGQPRCQSCCRHKFVFREVPQNRTIERTEQSKTVCRHQHSTRTTATVQQAEWKEIRVECKHCKLQCSGKVETRICH